MTRSTSGLAEVSIVVGGWAAVAALFLFDPLPDPGSPDSWWGAETLLAAAVAGLLVVLVAVDAVRVRRAGAARVGRVHLVGLGLAGIAWLAGGLVELVIYFIGVHDGYCSGTSALGSFECVNRPGPLLDLVGVVSALVATPVLAALIAVGRYSRVAAWLSPVVVIAVYLLAAWLWQPHVGFGVPDRPFLGSSFPGVPFLGVSFLGVPAM